MQTGTAGASRRTAAVTAAVAAGVLTLAAGCGSSGTSGQAAAPASHHAMSEPAVFGPDCGMIPHSGMGSLHSMSMASVVVAARHNPLLTAFAADVKKAGLTGDLTAMRAVTVFAPANSALSKLPADEMSMLHSRAELATVLKNHVVSGRVTPAELASGKPFKTLAGESLTPAKMGSVYEVGKASVICGNIQTANATVYVINKVLVPMHSGQ
jgi:uncharacterized surface protein with fasciclin (FAS1) repeats